MRKVVIAAVLVACAGATPVFAQGHPQIEPYIGVFGGYDDARYQGSGVSNGFDGGVYGAMIGVQTNISGRGVLGLEAEISDAGASMTTANNFVAGDSLHISLGRDVFVGARAGYRVTPRVMLYAKGGYTNARASVDYVTSSGEFHARDDLDGFRVGGGGELAVGRLRFRAEYRYSEYQNFKYQGVDTGVGTHSHQVVVGAAMAF